MTTVIVVIAVALLLFASLRLWITANRLDRLHVRTEAAWSALEVALARRIVASRAIAAAGGLEPDRAEELRRLADAADHADRAHRADAENDLSRVLGTVAHSAAPELVSELADAGERVALARRFHNDAVRDTRALRAVLFTRIFGLAGHAAMPGYFEIVEPPHPVVTPRQQRTAARVVLLDAADRILLLSGTDPAVASRWWHTPGGGVDPGEDLPTTALRELAEETGFRLNPDELVGPIWRRVAQFTFVGVDYEQTEFFFAARVPAPAPDRQRGTGPVSGAGGATLLADPPLEAPDGFLQPALDVSGHTAMERLTLTGHRWWRAGELAETDEEVYPVELAARLPEALGALLDRPVHPLAQSKSVPSIT